MKNFKKMFGISIIVALASQVNLGLFKSDFVVSAGAIIFATFLYYNEDIYPVSMGILSGISVYLLRLSVHQIYSSSLHDVIISFMPEILFYMLYGVFYKQLVKNEKKDKFNFVFFALILCDFSANFIEGLCRFLIFTEPNIVAVIPSLIIVSVVRSFMVFLIIMAFNYYDLMLTKREHEERYKRLLLLTSKLKSEIFWIEKTMDSIENVMTQSYSLFEQISNNEQRDDWANKALNIAREVHEIKKENGLVVRGIKSITDNELNDKGMEYEDINNILLETMEREVKNTHRNIIFEFEIGDNFYTNKHYYLMSVLRNLIMNSMDALPKSKKDGKISIIHETDEKDHIFLIGDNGEGIGEDDLESIFSPGFSTKINYDTGEINRGLGLSIVQYIVEEQLSGHVDVKSKQAVGTTFIIKLPKVVLEDANENIHS